MKYLLLITASFLTLAGYGQDQFLQQKIGLKVENAPLDSVLEKITFQTSINFSYNSKSVDASRKLTLDTYNQPLQNVLDLICDQLDLEYKVVKDQIILKPANKQAIKKPGFTLSGYIRDKQSGETLPGATVFEPKTETGTISNNYGFYSLTLPNGTYGLQYSFVGFEQKTLDIDLNTDRKQDVEMAMNAETLGEVTIVSNEKLEEIEKSQMSRIKVNPASLNTLPEFAGEVGLIKSLQTFPGIKTHSDGSAFFFVRGGNKDQNLILIDEAPVYNPAHLFGYYSVIIPDVAKDISLYKADLPVDKGDRLSSLIDVQTKDGNMKKFGISGVLNPLIYRIAAEGPIAKDKASVFTSFRHSNFKWIYSLATDDASLYLFDLNAKLNWKINKNNRLYYSFFFGKDNFTNRNVSNQGGIRWYNFTSTLRWNHVYSNRLFSNLTIYGSTYNYNLLAPGTIWESEITNFSLNYDFSFFRNPETTLKFGFSQTFHEFNPGNLANGDENPYVPKISAPHAAKTVLYFNRDHTINEKWS